MATLCSVKLDPRPMLAAALAVGLATVGCSGADQTVEQPAPASTQPAAPAADYTGPDESTLREQYLPALRAQQSAAEAGLVEVSWLGEPRLGYRQSMNDSVVASMYVIGTTQADAQRSDAWLQQANEQLAAHGFDPVAELTEDAGGVCWSSRRARTGLPASPDVGARERGTYHRGRRHRRPVRVSQPSGNGQPSTIGDG